MGFKRSAAIACAIGLTMATPAAAGEYRVDSTADRPDAKTGDNQCRTALATCTLRAALQEANATSAADVVLVPAGRYTLATAPFPEAGLSTETDAGNGDLDIAGSLVVRGAGARDTTVDGGGLDRSSRSAATASPCSAT